MPPPPPKRDLKLDLGTWVCHITRSGKGKHIGVFLSKACGLGCLWYALLAEDVCNLKPTFLTALQDIIISSSSHHQNCQH